MVAGGWIEQGETRGRQTPQQLQQYLIGDVALDHLHKVLHLMLKELELAELD